MRPVHPDPLAEVSLACDASDTHVGAVLQQWSPNGWQPLSFYSKKLNDLQRKYSTFDRELLSVFLAVCHFRFLLEGRRFHIETNHKPLTYALHRTSEPWIARQPRQLSYLAEFDSDVRHVAGSRNLVANSLSRPTVGGVNVSLLAWRPAAEGGMAASFFQQPFCKPLWLFPSWVLTF